ncbi:hypothetical protein B296_00000358 [Ensete ventricosum]|uniref:Uncharacterized protein n=1 Tax=Ensete ventricosum TaxID=4639 RepID=A0A426ZRI5_ENSVE|nr:hypothetical protein B296_00000358 [Ensete ventricosum]
MAGRVQQQFAVAKRLKQRKGEMATATRLCRTSAVDSITSDACLLLERENYTDEERFALEAEDVQESGDG